MEKIKSLTFSTVLSRYASCVIRQASAERKRESTLFEHKISNSTTLWNKSEILYRIRFQEYKLIYTFVGVCDTRKMKARKTIKCNVYTENTHVFAVPVCVRLRNSCDV